MVIPCGKHRGIERAELLRCFPSYALWAHRTVNWLELTPNEIYECKTLCVRRVGAQSLQSWVPQINYDELPRRRRRQRQGLMAIQWSPFSSDEVPW